MGNGRNLKILIIAEAANPEWTSVPLLGWSFTYALSKRFDVHLVTQQRNREAIERIGWKEGREFTQIDTEAISKPVYKLASLLRGGKNLAWTITTALASLTYPYFEYLCWKKFKKALSSGEYDLVHRITPVSPTAPSFLASRLKKINVPFVVGPLNGGVAWPKEFTDLRNKEKEWLTIVRGVYKVLPGYRALRKNAKAIVCGSMATKEQMPPYCEDRLFYLPENAIDTARFSKSNTSSFTFPLKAVFIGRLVPYKGADMAILAMRSLMKEGKLTYDIYGSGPEEERLKQLVAQEGLESEVKIHGFIPHNELQDKLLDSDLLVFPSVREFGGGVVLEAMAMGIVPVIADYAGPSELVTKSSGYKVPMGNREELVKNFEETLRDIVDSPNSLEAKRKECLRRVNKYYTWDAKVSQMERIYLWSLGKAEKEKFTPNSFE